LTTTGKSKLDPGPMLPGPLLDADDGLSAIINAEEVLEKEFLYPAVPVSSLSDSDFVFSL